MGFRRRKFQREEPNKREIAKREKEEKEKNIQSWCNLFYDISEKDNCFSEISIKKEGLKDFFEPCSFKTNTIHIIRGNNGQGKSTLLKNIANSTMGNILDSLNNRLKIGSNNHLIGEAFNGDYMNPYRMQAPGSLLGTMYKNNLSNLNYNITFYVDFSIEFYREETHSAFNDIIEIRNESSNGERKISTINEIFKIISLLKKADVSQIKKGINIVVILDEPESGLSINIQKEFRKKLMHYIRKMPEKVSLTFFIASHSFVWDKNEIIEIHNIVDYKNHNQQLKKEHQKVFI